MSRRSQRPAGLAGLPPERAAYLGSLLESGAVQVAADGKRRHRLPGGRLSMLRVNHGLLLTRPDPARRFVAAMAAFVERGFDDHVVLAGTATPAGAHLTGAVAHVLGVRQALVPVAGAGGPMVRPYLPANLADSPASAVVVLTDMLTAADTATFGLVRSLGDGLSRQGRPAPVYVLAGLVRDYDAGQQALAVHGAALHYLLSLRTVAADPRLRLSAEQRRLVRAEFD